MDAKVTVIIPCYQQGRTLAEAAESALRQTHPAMEVIIIDDGSTDDTASVADDLARRFAGRVKVIHQANQGQHRARQRGLDAATGEFCITLDADDLLEPGAAEACLRAFAAHPEADAVVGGALITGSDGREILGRHDQGRIAHWPEVLERNPYGVNLGVMTRTASLRAAGGLEFTHSGCEDWDAWCRMTRLGMRFVAVDAVLGRYRQTGQNHTRRVVSNLRATIAMLDLAAGEDPRLAAAGRPAAPPIAPGLYQRYRNGRVFHALGLGLGCGLADAEARAIAAMMVAGELDCAAGGAQFGDGLRFARMQPNSRKPSTILLIKILKFVSRRMKELEQAGLIGTMRAALVDAARQAGILDSTLGLALRLRERLVNYFNKVQ